MRLTKQHIDIVALQEPVISDHMVTVASRDWRVIYPSMHARNPASTRSVILICMDIHTNNWLQIDFDSSDVMAIEILGTWGKLMILNIYNDCDHDTIIDLVKNFQRNLDDNNQVIPNEEVHMIWLRDFNRHPLQHKIAHV